MNSLFMAVKMHAEDVFDPLILTPNAMRWQDATWLLDLRPCLAYWEMRASRAKMPCLQFWCDFMREQCRHPDQFYVCVATNPWDALLLLRSLEERSLPGSLGADQPFGQTLLRQVGWSTWYQCAKEYGTVCHEQRRRKFQLGVFHRQCHQMQQMVERLGLSCPADLQTVPLPAVRRRFGSELSKLWEWTYTDRFDADAEDFPWQSYKVITQPMVRRHLEHPLSLWEQLAPLLQYDLDRLCEHADYSDRSRVICLKWSITLSDTKTYDLRVHFRNPHALHREKGYHKTALLQAMYAFNNAVSQLFPSVCDFFEPIIHWTVAVEGQIRVPLQAKAFFLDDLSCDNDGDDVLALENKLPIPLDAYGLKPDWLPENSYEKLFATASAKKPEFISLWLTLAKARPLYIYEHPQPMAANEAALLQRAEFTERLATPWWEKDAKLSRDYFQAIDAQKRSLWIYRDTKSGWNVHGIFA